MKRVNHFSFINPFSCFFYYLFIITSCFVFNSPIFLLINISCAIINSAVFDGIKKILKRTIMLLPFLLLISAVNPLFNHNGNTPLFYINSSPFTLEAMLYGFLTALMLLCSLVWFSNMNRSIDSDKIIYITSKALPTTGLMLSMILKTTAQARTHLDEIKAVQQTFGISTFGNTLKNRLKAGSAILSSLTAIMLENGVDTAASMKSRGFDGGRRHNIVKYKFHIFDIFLFVISVGLFACLLLLKLRGYFDFTVIPQWNLPPITLVQIISYVLYTLFLLTPVIYNLKEMLKWNSIKSRI